MSNEALNVRVKWVPEQQVVGVRRFIKGEHEIQEEIGDLRTKIGEKASGHPVCFYLEQDEEKDFDVEICIPVAEALEVEDAFCRVIPGDHVLWTTHVGPYIETEDRPGMAETLRRLAQFINKRKLLVGDNPRRSVYLEGPEAHAEHAENYVTEIQVSYHVPLWLDSLKEGIVRCKGEKAARTVLAGSEDLVKDFDANKIRAWVRGAMDRLDNVISDKRARACVMNECAHRHPKPPLERWKAAYEEAGSLKRFIERLETDKELYPPRVWREEDGPKNVLYVERVIPAWNRETYEKTDDPQMKRYHACFCVMVKDAILNNEELSPTFCDCSAGWFVQIWEYLLGRKLQVDVVETVLQGANRCVFAVHLPEELL